MLRKALSIFGNVILSLAYRGKTTYVVYGDRRSGNHAFIKWLVAAIEGENISYEQDSEIIHFNRSESGKIVFLNEINIMRWNSFFGMIVKRWGHIRKASHVILSVEDVPPTYSSDYRLVKPCHAFYVKRSLLNVIASRYRFIEKFAKEGIGVRGMNIDEAFFERQLAWHTHQTYITTWRYDDWLTSSDYRQQFLKKIGLSFDSTPTMTTEGGGSSFSGQNQLNDSTVLTTRYQQVDLPRSILKRIKAEKYQPLLTADELKILEIK